MSVPSCHPQCDKMHPHPLLGPLMIQNRRGAVIHNIWNEIDLVVMGGGSDIQGVMFGIFFLCGVCVIIWVVDNG